MKANHQIDINLGCETCPNIRSVSFSQFPTNVLFGVDTSGVPGSVSTTTEITSNSDVPLYEFENNFLLGPKSCIGECKYSEKIAKIAEQLIKHTDINKII